MLAMGPVFQFEIRAMYTIAIYLMADLTVCGSDCDLQMPTMEHNQSKFSLRVWKLISLRKGVRISNEFAAQDSAQYLVKRIILGMVSVIL